MSRDVGERAYVGQRIRDRYRILSELGSGALGTVCVAEDETTSQRVAVRFLPRELAAAPGVVRAVQSVGRALVAASASHPGLVRVLDFGEAEPGQPFAVMELVEGRLLSDILAKPVEASRARRWAVGLGGAVEALHNVGLTYGRLRPRNVMVLPDGRIKLLDVEVTGLLGTPVPQNVLDRSPAEYLAPEQIRRAPATEKTDIYALAVIVYEMMAGAPPFQAPTRDAVTAKHLSDPPLPIARHHASPSAERIVMQALEKDPELRPWMHEMLNGLWEETNVVEKRSWKRPALVGAGVVLAASVAAVGIWGLLVPRTPTVRSVAPAPSPPRAEHSPVAARPIPSLPPASQPALTRTEPARPAAPVTVAAPAATVPPPSTPAPARPAPSAPPAEPRVAPAPAAAAPVAPPAPVKAPAEPAKATPPAAPPSPRLAVAPSSGVGAAVSAEVQTQRRTYRVGWLDSGRATAPYQDIVKQALVGYPRDVAFEYRSAEGQAARLQGLAAELVELKVDVLLAVGNQAIQAARQATTTIPIVMLGSDAVRRDEAGNVTGVVYSSADLARGWVNLLKEIRPLSRVAVVSGSDAASRAELTSIQTAAGAGARIQPYAIQDGDALFSGPPGDRAEAIIVPGGPMAMPYLPRIVDLAGRARVPAIYGSSEFAEAGGLIAYGPSTPAMYRRAGAYIGKILGPTSPRDLPIDHPSRFELVVNLKTARALGLTLPSSLVLRADRVLQ